MWGLLAAIKSDRTKDILKSQIIRVGQRFGLTFDIGQIAIEFFPPALVVEQLRVYHYESADPQLVLQRGRVVINPWPSATGALLLKQVDVDQLVLNLEQKDLETFSKHSEGSSAVPGLDIETLNINHASINISSERISIATDDLNAYLAPVDQGGRRFAFGTKSLLLTYKENLLPIQIEGQGLLQGTLDRPQKIVLQQLRTVLPDHEIVVTGAIPLENNVSLDLAISGSTKLASLPVLSANQPAMRGSASFRGKLRGSHNAPSLETQIEAEDLEIEDILVGHVDLDAQLDKEHLQINNVRVENSALGSLSWRGSLNLKAGLPFAISLLPSKTSLPVILEAAGLKDPWVRLVFSGSAGIQGTLQPFVAQGTAQLQVEQFSALNGSFHDKNSLGVFNLENVAIAGEFNIDRESIKLVNTSLQKNSTTMRVGGLLNFDAQRGMQLDVEATHFDFSDVSPIASVPFAGEGWVKATIQGPYADLQIAANTNLKDFGLLSYTVGDTETDLTFRNLILDVPAIRGRRGEGVFEGQCKLDFRHSQPTIHSAFKFSDIALDGVLKTLRLHDNMGVLLEANLTGEIHLEGVVQQPTGVIEAHGETLSVGGHSLGRMRGTLTFGTNTEVMTLDAEANPAGGRLHTHWALNTDNTQRIEAEMRRVPLLAIRPFIGEVPIGGLATLDLLLEGTHSELSGQVTAQVTDTTAYGVTLGTSSLKGSVDKGQMKVRGSLLAGDIPVEVDVKLGQHLPFVATASVKNLNVDRLWPLPENAVVQISGTLFSQGDLADASSLLAQADVHQSVVRFGDFRAQLSQPVQLSLVNRRYELGNTLFKGAGAELKFSGSFDMDDNIAFSMSGNGDLQALGALMDAEFYEGTLEFAGKAAGTWDQPSFEGTATLRRASLRIGHWDQTLDDFSAQLNFRGEDVVIENARGTLGGGTVELGGSATWSDGLELNLRADLNAATLQPIADLTTAISGSVQLVGPTDDLILKGRVRIDSLRYTANFDLESLIPRRNAAPLRVTAFDPDSNVALAVRVTAPSNIILSNNVLEAEFKTDLTITGNSDRVGLIGSLTPLWAKARYGDTEFNVERAQIDFSEEYKIFTRFEILAKAKACGIDIGVEVYGSSDSYTVAPTGTDSKGSVDPQDVLSCLQFGIRLANLSGRNATAGAVEALQGSLDALWTVSGVDEVVRKALPIQLDEVRLTSGWSTRERRNTPRLLVGKDIGKKLRLEYSRSLETSPITSFSAQYRLSDLATVQASLLNESNPADWQIPLDLGLDLTLHWSFR